MEEEALPVKVYYMANGSNKEIRKFTLDQDAATNYAYVIGRIKTFFVTLLRKELNLYWKDDEDEYISVSSDDELFEVIKNAGKSEDNMLKLYVKVKDDEATLVDNPHSGIVCDGCDKSINGIRYKCTVCHDFDLCFNCESQQAHPPQHHLLCMKATTPIFSYLCKPFPRQNRQCRRNFAQRKCPDPKDEASSKGPEKDDSNKQCGENVKEFVSGMASSFGCDPDVVVSQAQSFIDTFQSGDFPEGLKDLLKPVFEQWTESEHTNEDTRKETNEKNEKSSHRESNVNGEEEKEPSSNTDSMGSSTSSNDNPNFQTPRKEKEQSDAPPSNPPQGLYAEAISPFLSQMGMPSEFSNDQLQNLGKVMEAAMQNIAAVSCNGTSSPDVKESCESVVNEKSPSDGFVLLNECEGGDSLNEKEMFEKRLEEALVQMKAMGFDNDGDWLKQLLVAKNTDISKVLDALSPEKK